MKATISNALFKRIQCAKNNGSVVAARILEELDKDIEDIFDGNCNYFNSKRYIRHVGSEDFEYGFKSVEIEITYCNKDITNPRFPDHGNPKAPYFSENRSVTSPNGFVDMFVNLRDEFTSTELQYFDSAIRCDSKVSVRIGETIEDFYHAYHYKDYSLIAQNDDSTLHKSCMRHDVTARKCSDFYANFAKNKILIAENEAGEVVGRCLLWDDVWFDRYDETFNLIERCYTAFYFVEQIMKKYAVEQGYSVCKTRNTYDSQTEFTFMTEQNLHGEEFPKGWSFSSEATYSFSIPKYHKKGAAYLDTFEFLFYDPKNERFVLSNSDNGDYEALARLRESDCCPSRYLFICPICGNASNNATKVCYLCDSKMYFHDAGVTGIIDEIDVINGIVYPKMYVDATRGNSSHANAANAYQNLFA